MWGNPGHLSEMARKIRGKESDLKNVILPGEFQVLVANTNVEDYTYDGVDHGGERVAEEVRSRTLGSSISNHTTHLIALLVRSSRK